MGDIPAGTPVPKPFVIHEMTPEEKERYGNSPCVSILKTPTAIFKTGDEVHHKSGRKLTFNGDSPATGVREGSTESSASSSRIQKNGINGQQEETIEIALSPTKSIRVSPESWRAYRAYQRYEDYPNETVKTDYAYSRLSPYHNREITPGVTMPPNMSRPALHASWGAGPSVTTPVTRLQSKLPYSEPLTRTFSHRLTTFKRKSLFASAPKISNNWLWLLIVLIIGSYLLYKFIIPISQSHKYQIVTKASLSSLQDLVRRIEDVERTVLMELEERKALQRQVWRLERMRDKYQSDRMSSLHHCRRNHLRYLTKQQESQKKLEEKLSQLEELIESDRADLLGNISAAFSLVESNKNNEMDNGSEMVYRVVEERLKLYDSDKTGMADYALESAGGSVVGIGCTQPWPNPTSPQSFDPFTAIRKEVAPGECWAFQGEGHLKLRLAYDILVSGCTIEHISGAIHPFGVARSAPKEFSLWGLHEPNDVRPHLFGNYTFQIGPDAPTLQTFPTLYPANSTFNLVELIISSNHGYNYTCLYRIRIH